MSSKRSFFTMLGALCATFMLGAPAFAADADTVTMAHDPGRYGIVVSATKSRRDPLEIPNATAIVSGAELRQKGARTLADALIDVAGLETGGGSDNGSRLPNIGMWGLKEFDALLITVDGVPVGGPFNPSLAQIAVDDVERIEIVKGPQGSLHGVSAFAGMIQVFTDRSRDTKGSVTLGGGDFTQFNGAAQLDRTKGDWHFTARASGQKDDGWQERSTSENARVRFSMSREKGADVAGLDLTLTHDRADFASPLPVDGGLPVPGFTIDRNYGVRDGEIKHDIVGLQSRKVTSLKLGTLHQTAGASYDAQKLLRSFFPDPGAIVGVTAIGANGVLLEPKETTIFEDLNVVSTYDKYGHHESVFGLSFTYGKTTADGIGFDFDQDLDDPATVPNSGDVPVGDRRSFNDTRTFGGLYAHHDWTPLRAFTLSGGGRFDAVSEKLKAFGQEVGSPAVNTSDDQNTSAWSGDLGALLRLVPDGTKGIEAVNLYGNWKSSFKPAAPNLSEAENANILDPERTHSIEGGVKARALNGQVSLDVSGFQMDFHNMVVTILDPSLNPVLVNAGHERFKGWDVALALSPNMTHGLTVKGGYGWHDPRFVNFTFVTPDGTFRDVSGKLLELAPRLLWNAGAAYTSPQGVGAWFSVRHQGIRALNRRNRFFDEPFSETDAGVSYDAKKFRINVTGRNLGDDRHYVAESEIGDSQFYVSPPRRIAAQLTLPF